MSTVKERVKMGAKFLDRVAPGWYLRINPNTLELSSGESCICGQTFKKEARKMGDYYNGYEYATDTLFSESRAWLRGALSGGDFDQSSISTQLGFIIGDIDPAGELDLEDLEELCSRSWGELQDEWLKYIAKRLQKELTKK